MDLTTRQRPGTRPGLIDGGAKGTRTPNPLPASSLRCCRVAALERRAQRRLLVGAIGFERCGTSLQYAEVTVLRRAHASRRQRFQRREPQHSSQSLGSCARFRPGMAIADVLVPPRGMPWLAPHGPDALVPMAEGGFYQPLHLIAMMITSRPRRSRHAPSCEQRVSIFQRRVKRGPGVEPARVDATDPGQVGEVPCRACLQVYDDQGLAPKDRAGSGKHVTSAGTACQGWTHQHCTVQTCPRRPVVHCRHVRRVGGPRADGDDAGPVSGSVYGSRRTTSLRSTT